MTWVRTFELETRTRRFDATMVYSEQRDRIVDYLGTHQHLAVDIDLSVAENGGLRIRTGGQRLYVGPIGIDFPMFFSGVADVREWYDNAEETFRVTVTVTNPYWGPLFGYRGRFDVDYRSIDQPRFRHVSRPSTSSTGSSRGHNTMHTAVSKVRIQSTIVRFGRVVELPAESTVNECGHASSRLLAAARADDRNTVDVITTTGFWESLPT